jgi:hypothetical protein
MSAQSDLNEDERMIKNHQGWHWWLELRQRVRSAANQLTQVRNLLKLLEEEQSERW